MTPLWVVDTNVLVSAAISPGGLCDRVLQHAVRGTFRIAWDNTLLAEYRDVLGRPRFGLSPSAVRRLLAALPATGFRRAAALRIELPDPDDLAFVELAAATEEKTIVTGNPRHFPRPLMRRLGVKILSPRDAYDQLEALAS